MNNEMLKTLIVLMPPAAQAGFIKGLEDKEKSYERLLLKIREVLDE